MNITVIGAGYVGLVTGACFAELGNLVTCVDVDEKKVAHLRKGILPIYEPGLEHMVNANLAAKRLNFVTSLAKVKVHPEVIFIAVGTPSDKDGSADMQFVEHAARDIGSYIKKYCVIVDKSTVPVGMAERVKNIIQQQLKQRKLTSVKFDMASNPEFLREGAAIEDFMHPDRVIIGLSSKNAKSIMQDLYLPIMRNPEKIYFMNVQDAEMTKYAANAMLATRISFMNEMAVLCERLGVDIDNVRMGIGSDSRIGTAFINSGCGYGGSCFPKDVRALIKMAEKNGFDPFILKAVEQRNFQQKQILSEKIIRHFGDDLSSIKLGIWGLSFKPGTDDMREASSLILLEQMIHRGAKIFAYDPVALSSAKNILPKAWFKSGQLKFVEHQYDALKEVDAMVLVTEWSSFRYPDFPAMKKIMRQHVIVDGRNQYDPKQLKDYGFTYYGVGRSS